MLFAGQDQADFEDRRLDTYPLGIDIGDRVSARLIERFGHIPELGEFKGNNRINLEELVTETTIANDLGLQFVKDLHDEPGFYVPNQEWSPASMKHSTCKPGGWT